MRVQNCVCLLRVQSVRAGLDRLCSGRNLNFKWAQRACTIIQFGRGEKISAYSAGVALRASIALGSQPGAFSVPGAEEKIRINSRADIKVRGGSVRGIERSAGVIDDSVTGVASSWASCGVKASKGTRGSDDDAVPEISSGSRSLYPVMRVVCQPEKKTGQLEGFGPS